MYSQRRNNGEEKHKGAVHIGALFEKYKKHLRPPQGVVISTFCSIAATELGIILTPTQVRYNAHVRLLSVIAGGPQKSEILFNKTRLLALCSATLGDLGTPKHIV